MSKSRHKLPWLLASVVNDVGMLCLFKYAGAWKPLAAIAGQLSHFIAGSMNYCLAGGLNGLLPRWDVSWTIADPGAILPIGMSFYIFQSLTYSIGHYRGEVDCERNFLRFAAFVAMFPQLLSGPIERAENLLPQLRQAPAITREDVADGLSLFVIGLFKKVILADYLALYVDKVYASPGQFQASALHPGNLRLRLADLLRLQRLHRHGPRRRPRHGHPLDAQFQPSVPGHRAGRFLAPLAHQPFDLVPRLRLHSPGREPSRNVAHVLEHLPHDGHLRPVARSYVELRALGRATRPGARCSRGHWKSPTSIGSACRAR